MAGGMQVSGLASGLDSATIISQLMAAERRAGTGLTTSKTQTTTLISALQRLNTLVKDMSTAATAMQPDLLTGASPWSATTAKPSDASVLTATTTNANAAAPGSYSLVVKQVAAAGSTITDKGFASPTDTVSASGFTINLVPGKADPAQPAIPPITVAAGASLRDVADSINAAKAGVSAAVVTKTDGLSYLQLTSAKTGAGSEVRMLDDGGQPLSQFGGAMLTVTAGRDTIVQVGDAAQPGAYEVSSSTAKVEGVVPGVTITALKRSDTPVSVDVTADTSGIADKMQKLVDTANAVMSNVRVNAKWDSSQKYSATNPLPPFVGDATTRELLGKVSDVFVGNATMLPSSIGVDLQRDGSVKFDREKFLKALAENPAPVEKTATDLAKNLDSVGKATTNPADGFLTVRLQGSQALLQDYTRQIASFEDRMTQRQGTLERQFAALETMLMKLKNQGNWLQGQLAGLSSSSK